MWASRATMLRAECKCKRMHTLKTPTHIPCARCSLSSLETATGTRASRATMSRAGSQASIACASQTAPQFTTNCLASLLKVCYSMLELVFVCTCVQACHCQRCATQCWNLCLFVSVFRHVVVKGVLLSTVNRACIHLQACLKAGKADKSIFQGNLKHKLN